MITKSVGGTWAMCDWEKEYWKDCWTKPFKLELAKTRINDMVDWVKGQEED